MINIRRKIRGQKDQELLITRSEAQSVTRDAERGYLSGGVDLTLASNASEAVEIITVANSEIRRRVESGGSNSHLRLQASDAVSPKRVERGWGKWLSERRRV